MIQLTPDEISDLRKILYWARTQICNSAVRIDAEKALNLLKQKENESSIDKKG